MMINKNHFFTLFALFWISLGWLGLLLSLFGIFYQAIIIAYIFLGAAFFIYLAISKKIEIKISRPTLAVLVFSLLAVLLFSFYTTPTIFSGRDQGALSEAAIRLSQNHQLEFSFPAAQEFFKIYGPGRAFNFPGFNYTAEGNLITQFPLGYILWLAVFYSFIGLNGFLVANGLAFFIFLLSFYLLARQYLKISSSLITFALVLTSFVFSWFFKFTLGENLALALVWFGIYEFVLFIKNQDIKKGNEFHLAASLLSFGLLAFVRIEALAFWAVIAIILFVKNKGKNLVSAITGRKITFLVGGIILIYLLGAFINSYFYITLAKVLLKSFVSLGENVGSSAGIMPAFIYTFKVFSAYGLFNFIVFGIIGFIYFIKRRNFEFLIPYFIVLPGFIYLINPSISGDHPWMLRRFLFAAIPAGIFYTILFLDRFFTKRIYFYIFSGMLIVSNLIVFIPYLPVSPNKNLLPQTKIISENFSDSDLVLIDREATGDGWSMMAGPMNFLYGKQAVYFFNPADISKIDLAKFSNIYFIIPDSQIEFYKESGFFQKITAVKDYQIENNILDVPSISKSDAYQKTIELPKEKSAVIRGKIYLLKK